MYVYDQAHSLAKAIRESEELKLLKLRQKKIEAGPEVKKMFTDYRSKQFEIQKLQLSGQAVPEELNEAMRRMHDIVILNPVIREYLEAENRFGIMMNDIQKILADGIQID